jgi:hypothetical protein
MLSFLVPSALFGALLLVIPVAVHLFKPRKVRPLPFSSLRWLRQSKQSRSRRVRWHQLLLFALRAGLIFLLVLALARPQFGSLAESRPVERFIVLDVSRSMGYRAEGRLSPIQTAKRAVADLVELARPGERTAILLTDTRTRVLTPLTEDARPFLPKLDAVQAGKADTDLGSALPVVRALLEPGRPGANAELYFMTDNPKQGWGQGDIRDFLKDVPVPVRVRLVNVGVPAPQNAWVADARLMDSAEPGRRVLRVEIAASGSATQERSVRVTGINGLPEKTATVTVRPGELARVDVDVPAGLELRGQVAQIRLEPPDALPDDDIFFLPLDTAATLRVLLVEGEMPNALGHRPGFQLRTALESLAASGNRPLKLVSRLAREATAKDVSEADVVFLAGVPALADAAVAAIEGHVQAGAGLVIFLGPDLRLDFYNEKLYRPLQPAQGLMPLPLVEKATPRRAELVPLANVRWNHPLLTSLRDPVLGDLAGTKFRSFYRITSAPGGTDAVLAGIDDEAPALVEHGIGAGKVLLFNTTADGTWSDLPRRQGFVPLVDRLLDYLAAGAGRPTFTAGGPVSLALPEALRGEGVSVRTPRGADLTPRLRGIGGKTLLHLDEVPEPGVYRVRRPGVDHSMTLVVNVGRGDCALSPMPIATLTQWWEPVSFDVVRPDALPAGVEIAESPLVLWPVLVALAGLLLLAEMFFVHRACPAVNPAVNTPVVARAASGRLRNPARRIDHHAD